jgi:phage N-6-adenine-methyltransferase
MRAIESGTSFSRAHDEWATPDAFFTSLAQEFSFTLDPCATAENAKCVRFFTREVDGLKQSWAPHVVWMNPPYSNVIHWMRKAYEESLRGATVVCLVPSRTDTRWWHSYVSHAAEVRFVRGRIKFGGAKYNAPFPSALVVFRVPVGADAAAGPRADARRLDASCSTSVVAELAHGSVEEAA